MTQMASMDVGRSGFAEKRTMKWPSLGFIEQFTVCGIVSSFLSHVATLLCTLEYFNAQLDENNICNIEGTSYDNFGTIGTLEKAEILKDLAPMTLQRIGVKSQYASI